MAKLLDEAARFRAASLSDQITALSQLREQAKQQMVAQTRKHADYPILMKLPGFGPVRIAQLLAIVGTPQRFRTKRQFWPYCGLSVTTRSSADYQVVKGQILKQRKKVAANFKQAGLAVKKLYDCQVKGSVFLDNPIHRTDLSD